MFHDSALSRSLSGLLVRLGVRDDASAKFEESKHPRSKNGQFAGKGTGGVNAAHFAGKGVGGNHTLKPSDPKSKALPHGMTVNEFIEKKHGGDTNKALSWLKFYHNGGKVELEAPKADPKPARATSKSTPLTKGVNAKFFNEQGVTKEHEIQATSKKSAVHGMTVGEYIEKKFGGDEGKALSYLKFFQKKGDLSLVAPGTAKAHQGSFKAKIDAVFAGEAKPKSEPELVVAASKKNEEALAKKNAALVDKLKEKEAKAQAKADEKDKKLHEGYSSKDVIEAKSPGFIKYHGKTVADYVKGVTGHQFPTAGKIGKAVAQLKQEVGNTGAAVHPAGTQLGEFEKYKAFGIHPDSVISLKSKLGQVQSVPGLAKYGHGMKASDFIEHQDPKQYGWGPDAKAYWLSKAVRSGDMEFLPPGSKAQPYDPFKSAGVSPDDKVQVNKSRIPYTSGLVNSMFTNLQSAFHGKTVAQVAKFENSYNSSIPPEATVNKIKKLVSSGHVSLVGSDGQVKPFGHGDAAPAGKEHWGQASFTPNDGKFQSFEKYNALAHQHLQPEGAEKSAMKMYSGSFYSSLNANLRQGKALTPQQESVTKHLDSFLNKSKLTEDMTLTRGFHHKELHAQLEQLKPGQKWSDSAFVSTSHKPDWNWSHGHKIIVRAKKGARGGFMDGHGNYNSEHEVLLPRNAQLTYAGRTKEGHFVFDHDT